MLDPREVGSPLSMVQPLLRLGVGCRLLRGGSNHVLSTKLARGAAATDFEAGRGALGRRGNVCRVVTKRIS